MYQDERGNKRVVRSSDWGEARGELCACSYYVFMDGATKKALAEIIDTGMRLEDNESGGSRQLFDAITLRQWGERI